MTIEYANSTRISDKKFKKIRKHLNLLSGLILCDAAALRRRLEKGGYSGNDVVGYFQYLFEGESKTIKLLLTKHAKKRRIDYDIVEFLFQKYLWEKLGKLFFNELICFSKQAEGAFKCMEEFFETSELYSTKNAARFKKQLATMAKETSGIFQTTLEDSKAKAIEEIFEDISFMKKNKKNSERIKTLVDKAAEVSQRMRAQDEEIVMKKLVSGDKFLEDQLETIEISESELYDEVLVGIHPVFLIKDWVVVDSKDSTYLEGSGLLHKGSAMCWEVGDEPEDSDSSDCDSSDCDSSDEESSDSDSSDDESSEDELSDGESSGSDSDDDFVKKNKNKKAIHFKGVVHYRKTRKTR